MPDNRIQAALREAAQAHRVREKVLVVRDLTTGWGLIRNLVQTGTPVANLRPVTLRELALELAQPALTESGLEPAGPVASLLLIDDLLSETLPGNPLGLYLGQTPHTPGLAGVLLRAVHDLRMAGLTVDTLDLTAFETLTKAEAIRDLMTRYEHGLSARGLTDSAGLYRTALDRLSAGPPHDDCLYLVPTGLFERKGLDQEFLLALTHGRTIPLTGDEPGTQPESTSTFHAAGTYNEVRETVRRVLGGAHPFDHVEIVVTDYGTYAPAIRDVLAGLAIPGTFVGGLSIAGTTPGRALRTLLDWIADGFHAAMLARALSVGLLIVPDLGPGLGPALSRILRTAPIGWGRDRYLPTLDAQVVELEQRLTGLEANPDDPEATEAYRHSLSARLTRVRSLRTWLAEVLGSIPTPDEGNLISLSNLCEAVTLTLRHLPRMHGPDLTAATLLTEVLAEAAQRSEVRCTLIDAARRLLLLTVDLAAGAAGPTPGSIFVTDLAGAGWSGRTVVYLLGLDEERFPGAGLQDPVLLDSERKAVSPALETSAARLKSKRNQLERLVAGVRGQLTVSYSIFDAAVEQAAFPSSLMLAVERRRTGNPTLDYTGLLQRLGQPIGYAPADDRGCLDRQDWWLSRLLKPDGRVLNGQAAVLAAHPFLARGLDGEEARESADVTHYDGWVGPDVELDPRRNPALILSPSRLELLGRCPREYFFGQVLGIAPPDELIFDLGRWLDPMQRGSLLHEIFHEFLAGLLAEGIEHPVPAHEGRLLALADGRITSWRLQVPPPTETIFAAEREELLRSVLIFLRTETGPEARGVPAYFELAFGMEQDTPVPVETAEGGQILLRGRIDRIDHLGGHEYAVWDYKTGSSSRYDERACFERGRQVQHGLYAVAVEVLLRRRGLDQEARVVAAGYLFPTEKGEGKRIMRPQNQRDALSRLLDDLADVAGQGLFVAAEDKHDCLYCDFRRACGAERAAGQTKVKLEASPVLEPWRRVAAHE